MGLLVLVIQAKTKMSGHKNSAQISLNLQQLVHHHQSIRCDEFGRNIHLSIATLVVEYQAQTFKGEKFRPIFSSIDKASPTYLMR